MRFRCGRRASGSGLSPRALRPHRKGRGCSHLAVTLMPVLAVVSRACRKQRLSGNAEPIACPQSELNVQTNIGPGSQYRFEASPKVPTRRF
ncbi:hypothetical protein GRAN_1022 [Granulicella sibirica]|uniref:Uncharacterized protein n=1 Tax=Granulicella sibirica TaxID=2479048 RepID=A0A4Q0T453_9BACT|nr:hypothetical protein GRAN_1022 [Granulicella sibirica]